MPAVQKRGILGQFKFTLVALCRFDSFWCVSSQFGLILGHFVISACFGLLWLVSGLFWGQFGYFLGHFRTVTILFWVILRRFGLFWLVLNRFEPAWILFLEFFFTCFGSFCVVLIWFVFGQIVRYFGCFDLGSAWIILDHFGSL